MTIETKNINSENALAAEIARCSEINRRVFEKTDELTRKDERELFKFEAELKAAGVDPVEVARKVYAKAGELSRKTSREILEFEAELKATTTIQIMVAETPAENNTAEEKPAVVEIPVKIIANGNVNFFLNGKRVSEKIALESSNYMSLYWAKILGYNGKFVENYFASPITAYQWLRRMADKNRNYADGSWIITRNGVIKDIFVRTSKKQTITDPQLQNFIDALDAKENIESMYRCAQRSFQHYQNYYGLTPAQAQEIYIAVHTDECDHNAIRAMIENFKAINSIETDGSEDDTDDPNDVFKFLPAIENLNDVEENTVAQVKIAQPQDNFTAELAKLKAERDAAQMLVKEKETELAQAKDVHQKANDAIDRFFRNAVEESREKLLSLPIDCIRVNTQEGFQPINKRRKKFYYSQDGHKMNPIEKIEKQTSARAQLKYSLAESEKILAIEATTD